ncbi:MAG: hypothetical protein ACXW5U_03430 [Thermoanaerobaculia bacterium]
MRGLFHLQQLDRRSLVVEALDGVQAQRTAIAPLPSGYVAAFTGDKDATLVVLDTNGHVTASRTLPAQGVLFLTTTAGGEIFAGIGKRSLSPDEHPYVRLTKLRPDLSLDWVRRIATAEGDTIPLMRGAGAADGGILVRGERDAGVVLTKVDARGAVEWSTSIDPSDEERINAATQMRDGGWVAVGATPRWMWIVRLAPDGKVEWQRAYGPATSWLESVAVASDGSILVVGNRQNLPFLMKLDARGDVVWSKVSATPGYGLAVVASSATQWTATITVSRTLHVVTFDGDGAIAWQRAIGSDEMSPMFLGYEGMMLARSRGAVALSALLGTLSPAVLQIDHSGAMPDCPWVAEGKVAFNDATVRREELAVEISSLDLLSGPGSIELVEATVAAAPETCASTTPIAMRSTPAPEPRTVAFRQQEDFSALRRDAGEMLLARQFAQLDAMADRLRRDRPSRDPMRPNSHLDTLYARLADDELAPVRTRLSLLREWRAKEPASLTAAVALAHALYRAAWDARGSGMADTVTATGSSQYDTYINEAGKVVGGLGAAGEADPRFWTLRIQLAHELGLGDASQIALRALARHADPEIALAAARYLYPQWGGSPEEYMAFANAVARATHSSFGDGLYFWLVYQIKNYDSSEDYKQYKTDWPRAVKAGRDLIDKYPEWLPSYHRLARLARRYGDRAAARAMFERPELEWFQDADRTWAAREVYEDARQWALEPPPMQ